MEDKFEIENNCEENIFLLANIVDVIHTIM